MTLNEQLNLIYDKSFTSYKQIPEFMKLYTDIVDALIAKAKSCDVTHPCKFRCGSAWRSPMAELLKEQGLNVTLLEYDQQHDLAVTMNLLSNKARCELNAKSNTVVASQQRKSKINSAVLEEARIRITNYLDKKNWSTARGFTIYDISEIYDKCHLANFEFSANQLGEVLNECGIYFNES